MKRRFAFPFFAAMAFASLRAQELPKSNDSLEIEPPILMQNTPDQASTISTGRKIAPARDAADLEKDVERAMKSAAAGERLFKMGVLAKVDVEKRALRVVRLQSELAEARLREAKNLTGSESEAELTRRAQSAARNLARAELEAAQINLRRQRKLFSLGSGRRSDVAQAEEKLAALQKPNP